LAGKNIVLCPLCELGFLRISSNKKALNAPMEKARDLLEKFATERHAERIQDDLAPLDSRPKTSEEVTDWYLADLSAKHGFRLATFDENINHPSVEIVPKNNWRHSFVTRTGPLQMFFLKVVNLYGATNR